MPNDHDETPVHSLVSHPDSDCRQPTVNTSNTNRTPHPHFARSHDPNFSSRERSYRRYRARPPHWKDFYAILYYLLSVSGSAYLWRIVYKNLPLRITSRMVGRLAKIRLPRWLRGPVYRCYGWMFQVNLEEIEHSDDLARYISLADFFQRGLLPSARKIDQAACLVSPVDGRVLSCGRVEAGHLEQVKGLFYTLRGLLGPNSWTKVNKKKSNGTRSSPADSTRTTGLHPAQSATNLSVKHRLCVTGHGLDYIPVFPLPNVQVDKTATPVLGRPRLRARSALAASQNLRLEDFLYAQGLLLNSVNTEQQEQCYLDLENEQPCGVCVDNQSTTLYHITVYLAPGDYHRFHSPADWSIQMRRHFPGKLYSVAPPFVSQLDRLYCINERVIYVGKWTYGFFAYVAVGATNVGSIAVYRDPDLVTNVPIRSKQLSRIWSIWQRGPDTPDNGGGREQSDYFDVQFDEPIDQNKGELFGQFNFGSTVILVFEAPANCFNFTVAMGSHIKVGQPVGAVR